MQRSSNTLTAANTGPPPPIWITGPVSARKAQHSDGPPPPSRFPNACRSTPFLGQLQSKAKRFERISWKTSGAFVVFNHETSVARCLADYARYPLWMQPRRLRFRQTHKIKVQRVGGKTPVTHPASHVADRVPTTVLVFPSCLFVSILVSARLAIRESHPCTWWQFIFFVFFFSCDLKFPCLGIFSKHGKKYKHKRRPRRPTSCGKTFSSARRRGPGARR